MRVLGIDTSSERTGVALVVDGACIGRHEADRGRDHSGRLLGAVLDLLATTGLDLRSLDRFAVAAGPGSFTGLRVGIATANGLAWALGRPAVGVPTLEACAWAGSGDRPGPVVPVLDARRGEVFIARFERKDGDGAGALERLSEDQALPPGEAFCRLVRPGDRLVGDGALRYRGVLAGCLPDADVAQLEGSAAEAVARLGAESGRVAAGPVRPLYLQRFRVFASTDRGDVA